MIRFYNKNDIKDIYKLGDIITNKFSKTNNLEAMLKDKYTKILVYEKDKKVIGFLMYTALEDSADIADIVVLKEYRNQKVASCLIDYMISELKETIKTITLEVRKSNFPAINLYEQFGFKALSIRKNYYGNEDAYLMGRSI
jgi:ribosomal-protein-alanine acetyltransferase